MAQKREKLEGLLTKLVGVDRNNHKKLRKELYNHVANLKRKRNRGLTSAQQQDSILIADSMGVDEEGHTNMIT